MSVAKAICCGGLVASLSSLANNFLAASSADDSASPSGTGTRPPRGAALAAGVGCVAGAALETFADGMSAGFFSAIFAFLRTGASAAGAGDTLVATAGLLSFGWAKFGGSVDDPLVLKSPAAAGAAAEKAANRPSQPLIRRRRASAHRASP